MDFGADCHAPLVWQHTWNDGVWVRNEEDEWPSLRKSTANTYNILGMRLKQETQLLTHCPSVGEIGFLCLSYLGSTCHMGGEKEQVPDTKVPPMNVT